MSKPISMLRFSPILMVIFDSKKNVDLGTGCIQKGIVEDFCE